MASQTTEAVKGESKTTPKSEARTKTITYSTTITVEDFVRRLLYFDSAPDDFDSVEIWKKMKPMVTLAAFKALVKEHSTLKQNIGNITGYYGDGAATKNEEAINKELEESCSRLFYTMEKNVCSAI